MNEGSEKWYTTAQAAEECNVVKSTLTRAIRDGRLVASEVPSQGRKGTKYMISETALFEWLEHGGGKEKGDVRTKRYVAKKYTDMSIEELAGELLRRLQEAYNQGYADGQKNQKREIMDMLKGVGNS